MFRYWQRIMKDKGIDDNFERFLGECGYQLVEEPKDENRIGWVTNVGVLLFAIKQRIEDLQDVLVSQNEQQSKTLAWLLRAIEVAEKNLNTWIARQEQADAVAAAQRASRKRVKRSAGVPADARLLRSSVRTTRLRSGRKLLSVFKN